MPISRHDPKFRQMAEKIFGTTQCKVVEKEQPSHSNGSIDASKRAGVICKGGQVIRIPKAQRRLAQTEEEDMPVRVSEKDFERLVGQCGKSVLDQFKTYRPAIKTKLAKAFEVWKNLPEDTFFAGKIEKLMESTIKNADRFVIMLRQVDLLEDAGKGLRGAILFRKIDLDDIEVVRTMVLGTSKMTAWSAKEKQAPRVREELAATEAERPAEGLEESAPGEEEATVESTVNPPVLEQEEMAEEFGEELAAQRSPEQPMDVAGEPEAAVDQPEERTKDLAELKTRLQTESDEFDEMRDEWRVFQRLFPNLGRKDFHRISFKNRFGEEL